MLCSSCEGPRTSSRLCKEPSIRRSGQAKEPVLVHPACEAASSCWPALATKWLEVPSVQPLCSSVLRTDGGMRAEPGRSEDAKPGSTPQPRTEYL